jgi:hypothetical protein
MSITVDYNNKNNSIQNYLSMPLVDNSKEQKSKPAQPGPNPGMGADINVNKAKKNSNFILKTEISRESTKIENNKNINDDANNTKNMNCAENSKKN